MKVMDIVRHLDGKGIKVLANHVYSIKGKKSKRGRPAASSTTRAKVSSNGHASPVQTLIRVKTLATEMRGLRNLKQFVEELLA